MRWICCLLSLAVGVAAGCASRENRHAGMQHNPSVLSVTPKAPATQTTVSPYAAALEAPSAEEPPAPGAAAAEDPPFVSQTPSAPPAPVARAAHTVQRGDTLYGLARRYYGDGKQWERIAAANPGVSPNALKIGDTLTIP